MTLTIFLKRVPDVDKIDFVSLYDDKDKRPTRNMILSI